MTSNRKSDSVNLCVFTVLEELCSQISSQSNSKQWSLRLFEEVTPRRIGTRRSNRRSVPKNVEIHFIILNTDTNHFNSHFPGQPRLASCTIDSSSLLCESSQDRPKTFCTTSYFGLHPAHLHNCHPKGPDVVHFY